MGCPSAPFLPALPEGAPREKRHGVPPHDLRLCRRGGSSTPESRLGRFRRVRRRLSRASRCLYQLLVAGRRAATRGAAACYHSATALPRDTLTHGEVERCESLRFRARCSGWV